MEHLKVRIKSLIKQRELLRKVFTQQTKLEPSEVTVTSLDEKFLDELLAKVEMEMDNSDLNVKLLSKMLGISSTNLYRKIKGLTGQTATEFIRNIRLKRAAQLLRKEQLNVSEVMYMVGFTHPSYFTRCFKDLYGVSPKAYVNNNNNKSQTNT
jgi:AraC-like DNA-binding protein